MEADVAHTRRRVRARAPTGTATQHAECNSHVRSAAFCSLLSDREPERPTPRRPAFSQADRKSVVSGKSVSVRLYLGGRRIIKKKNKTNIYILYPTEKYYRTISKIQT